MKLHAGTRKTFRATDAALSVGGRSASPGFRSQYGHILATLLCLQASVWVVSEIGLDSSTSGLSASVLADDPGAK
jgi:hypothetical protein